MNSKQPNSWDLQSDKDLGPGDCRQAGTANKTFPEMGGTPHSDTHRTQKREAVDKPESQREGAAAAPALPAPLPGLWVSLGGQGAARSVRGGGQRIPRGAAAAEWGTGVGSRSPRRSQGCGEKEIPEKGQGCGEQEIPEEGQGCSKQEPQEIPGM